MALPKLERAQQGYALLVVMLMASLLVISLGAALPGWKTAIQRERENRAIDNAREYRTAIKRYYHKNGRYPASLDVLIQKDGQGLRYLRSEYPDPLNTTPDDTSGNTGAGTWRLLHYGEAVADEVVDRLPQAAQKGIGGVAPGSTSTGMGTGTGPGSGSGASAGSGFSFGSPGSGAGPGSTSGQPGAGNTGFGGTPGVGTGLGTGVGVGLGGANSGLYGGAGTGAATGGPVMGGGPIIGVVSFSKKAAVHAFNGYDTPDHWQFVYDITQDPSVTGGGGAGISPGTGLGTPGGQNGLVPTPPPPQIPH